MRLFFEDSSGGNTGREAVGSVGFVVRANTVEADGGVIATRVDSDLIHEAGWEVEGRYYDTLIFER